MIFGLFKKLKNVYKQIYNAKNMDKLMIFSYLNFIKINCLYSRYIS